MNRNEPAALTVIFELHLAGDLRKQRVVLAEADVQSGLVLPAALTHENRAAAHEVALEALHAKPLRIAVAAVTRRSLSFFCSHYSRSTSLNLDVGDADARQEAPMALRPTILLAPLLLEHANLLALI